MSVRFTLRQLEYLVAVGQAGSVTLAAERMNVSAPSISTALAQLEAELGLPLFIRKHTQGMTATPAGRDIIREAIATLAAARTLAELAEQFHGKVKGSLTLGGLLTFAQILLPQLRRSFVDLHPDVDFHQVETHQAALIKGMLDRTLDVALTYDLALPPDLTFIDLGKLPPFVTVPADHPLTKLETVSIADLAGYPMVLLDLPYSSDYFVSLFENAGVKPRIAERSSDIGVVRALVANGFGFSITNFRPVTDMAPDGRKLAFLPLTGPTRPMQIGLLCRKGGSASLTTQAFVEHAKTELERLLPSMILSA
jgi:DNA-binding transcriptional LysR family regulator